MNKVTLALLLTAVAWVGMQEALAFPNFLNDFNATYPSAVDTRIDTCALCHINPAGGGPRNPYGTDFDDHEHNFTEIEPLDSDEDGFTNIAEINARAFPGNASDQPSKLTGSISGYTINDANSNGRWDAGETGILNWTIKLIGITGSGIDVKVIRKETTTDAEGFYMFDNLSAGEYIIIEKIQAGFLPTNSTVKSIKLAADGNSMNNNFTNSFISRIVKL